MRSEIKPVQHSIPKDTESSNSKEDDVPEKPSKDLQPIVKRVALAGDVLDRVQQLQWEKQRADIIISNEIIFFNHLKETLGGIKALKVGMRMRVDYGHLELTQYRRNFLSVSYSYDKFSQMMRESRTTARLERSIGDAALAFKFITAVQNAPAFTGGHGLVTGQCKHSP